MRFFLVLLTSSAMYAQETQVDLDNVISAEATASSQSSARQENINNLDEEFISLKADIQFLSQELDITNAYNNQLKKLIQSQLDEIDSINEQIIQLDQTARDITPFLSEMVVTLEELINIDIPFLMDERVERVSNLAAILDRADVSISEKFRQIFEAYQIENEFGRTIESYKDEIILEGNTLSADIFRIGRIGLYARTPDGNTNAMYHPKNRQWIEISGGYEDDILAALRISRKELPPNLINLPVVK